MDTRKIGQFLQSLRRESGLTQEQLGETLGVTGKTISRWGHSPLSLDNPAHALP